jgi:hypothetical protein
MNIITSIREKFAQYKLKKLRKIERKRAYIDWNKIDRILLLYAINNASEAQSSMIYSELYEILDNCFDEKTNVRLVVYVNKSPIEQKRFNITVFDAKSCNALTYKPNLDILGIAEEEDSDVVINLSPTLSFPLEYLAENSDAKLKISVLKTGKGAKYDMYFSSESESVKEVFESIKYYLQKIKAE